MHSKRHTPAMLAIAGEKTAAEVNVVSLTHTANLANDKALGFEFEYCRFEPSRFT